MKTTKAEICDVCGEEDSHKQLPNGDFICYSCDKAGMAPVHINKRRLVSVADAFDFPDSGARCNCEDYPCCGH